MIKSQQDGKRITARNNKTKEEITCDLATAVRALAATLASPLASPLAATLAATLAVTNTLTAHGLQELNRLLARRAARVQDVASRWNAKRIHGEHRDALLAVQQPAAHAVCEHGG